MSHPQAGALEHAEGLLFGGAIGDALGLPTEFLPFEDIVEWVRRDGPLHLTGEPALVTDDTQMTLAVGEALTETLANGALSPESLEPVLRTHLVAWLRSPDNTRAPGTTCTRGCERLAQGVPWVEATVPGSKGCGANMRVGAVALLPAARAEIAQYQAAFTHGHPTALAAADLTTEALHALLDRVRPERLLAHLREYTEERRDSYHQDWLGTHWQRPGQSSPVEFIRRGWDECAAALSRVPASLQTLGAADDPCSLTGDGWIAEEALATALLCFLATPDDPVAVVRRASMTDGDSDSIASIAGSLAGAYCGVAGWPADWCERVEYRERLLRLARDLGPAEPETDPSRHGASG